MEKALVWSYGVWVSKQSIPTMDSILEVGEVAVVVGGSRGLFVIVCGFCTFSNHVLLHHASPAEPLSSNK